MRVELLYWERDPDYMAARQNLVEVLNEDAFETPIQMVSVNSEEDAELLGFPGSPTIRLDGIDIEPDAAAEPGLRLRHYGDGERVPSRQLIRHAVERARGWGHGRPRPE